MYTSTKPKVHIMYALQNVLWHCSFCDAVHFVMFLFCHFYVSDAYVVCSYLKKHTRRVTFTFCEATLCCNTVECWSRCESWSIIIKMFFPSAGGDPEREWESADPTLLCWLWQLTYKRAQGSWLVPNTLIFLSSSSLTFSASLISLKILITIPMDKLTITNCRLLKKLTCKGTLRQVFTRVYTYRVSKVGGYGVLLETIFSRNLNTLYLAKFGTHKIAGPLQTKTKEWRGPQTDIHLPQSPFTVKFF